MRTHQLIDERSLALARAVVAKIDTDPHRQGLQRARDVRSRWMALHDNGYIRNWHSILGSTWPEIQAILLKCSEAGQAFRQCSPFCGVPTPGERSTAGSETGVTRSQLAHVIRAAGSLAGVDTLVVVGSQAMLGSDPDPPAGLVESMEADLCPPGDAEKADVIDGSIGEGSMFHGAFGYYAHGVGLL
jgi:hypothetical protein